MKEIYYAYMVQQFVFIVSEQYRKFTSKNKNFDNNAYIVYCLLYLVFYLWRDVVIAHADVEQYKLYLLSLIHI